MSVVPQGRRPDTRWVLRDCARKFPVNETISNGRHAYGGMRRRPFF